MHTELPKRMKENHFTINAKKLNLVLLFKISGLLRPLRCALGPRNDGEMSTAPSINFHEIILLYSEKQEKVFQVNFKA